MGSGTIRDRLGSSIKLTRLVRRCVKGGWSARATLGKIVWRWQASLTAYLAKYEARRSLCGMMVANWGRGSKLGQTESHRMARCFVGILLSHYCLDAFEHVGRVGQYLHLTGIRIK